jgi:hypothetical protein
VGLDNRETFSPVIRIASFRMFLAIVAAMDLELCQLDIDTAFLFAPVSKDVYIRQPHGFSDGTSKACHIKGARRRRGGGGPGGGCARRPIGIYLYSTRWALVTP